MDLKLTDDDIDLTNGALTFVTGKEALAQDLKMAWGTWLGETIHDQTAGVPWLQVIFALKNPNPDAIRLILKQVGERRPGFISIEIVPALDTVTRTLTVTGTADTVEGELDLTEIFAGESIVRAA